MSIKEVASIEIAVIALEDHDGFGICLPDGSLLKTPAGNLVESNNYRLISHVVQELREYPILEVEEGIIVTPRLLSAYFIYATQKDFTEAMPKTSRESFEEALNRDPILFPAHAFELRDQYTAWEPVSTFLASLDLCLRARPRYSHEAWGALVDNLAARFNSLPPSGKAVITNLVSLTDGNIISALAFVSGGISSIEFAHAVLATTLQHYTFGAPLDDAKPEEAHGVAFREIRDCARVCQDYLQFFPSDNIALLVARGESKTLEFKSTMRWDLRQAKKSDSITHASLKTLAAFLNTDGGTLLIGVDDQGSAVGIEMDQFSNDDKFLLHLYTSIKNAMGLQATSLIDSQIDFYGGKKVCLIKCKKSPFPVYLRSLGQDEEFFIRTGPSSERLGPSVLVSYISQHFVQQPGAGISDSST